MDWTDFIQPNSPLGLVLQLFNTKQQDSQKEQYEQLRYDYLKALENPNDVGYTFIFGFGIWTPPKEKGFDPNQIGIGLDTKYNKDVVEYLKQTGRTNNPWLTDQEMKDLQNKSLQYYEGVLDDYTKDSNILDTKRAVAIGLIYHGYGPKLWNKSTKISRAFFNETDKQFIDAVSDFYGNNTRAERHSTFWNSNRKY